MATAKRKTSARTTAKRAANKTMKNGSAAMHSAAHTTKANTRAGADWAQKNAADWQKGASDWAKQSAKMYQMPSFGQGDAGDVAKNAAASVQSATENMMKMGSDMMSQMFGQSKKSGFTPEAFTPAAMASMFQKMPNMFQAHPAQEKMSTMARESAEHLSKSAGNLNRTLSEAMELSRENTQAAAQASNTAMTVSKELGAEIMGYMNKLFTQNVELSKQVLSCRTLNDMFDLSSRIMKTNLDGFFSESVKVSEMIFQCANDVSEPLNECVSATTQRLTKAMAA